LHWQHRAPLLLRTIVDASPDIVCLQVKRARRY
jgi:hypothetical protein